MTNPPDPMHVESPDGPEPYPEGTLAAAIADLGHTLTALLDELGDLAEDFLDWLSRRLNR